MRLPRRRRSRRRYWPSSACRSPPVGGFPQWSVLAFRALPGVHGCAPVPRAYFPGRRHPRPAARNAARRARGRQPGTARRGRRRARAAGPRGRRRPEQPPRAEALGRRRRELNAWEPRHPWSAGSVGLCIRLGCDVCPRSRRLRAYDDDAVTDHDTAKLTRGAALWRGGRPQRGGPEHRRPTPASTRRSASSTAVDSGGGCAKPPCGRIDPLAVSRLAGLIGGALSPPRRAPYRVFPHECGRYPVSDDEGPRARSRSPAPRRRP